MNSKSVESVESEKKFQGETHVIGREKLSMLLYQYLESGASLKDRRQVS